MASGLAASKRAIGSGGDRFRTGGWVLGLVAVLAALAAAGCGNGEQAAPQARPAIVTRAQPAAQGLTAFAGEVRARHEPTLAFRVPGKIAKRSVEVGDRVEQGQVLAELDPDDARLQAEAARAQLVSAEADLALARAERARYATLAQRQVVSRSQFDSIDNTMKAAAARAGQARAQYDVARNQSGYSALRAPVAGAIARREAEAGQVVAAGQTVFVLSADGEREVAIAIPEQRVGEFAAGRPVVVELWAAPGKRFPGHVREIAPAADPASRTYAARVSFDVADVPVDVGQSARVYAAESQNGALSLPLTAIYARDGKPAVWVVDPRTSTLKLTPVELGAYGEDRVPVRAGLKPEDWVVAAGVHLLREGQAIKPIDRDNRPLTLIDPKKRQVVSNP